MLTTWDKGAYKYDGEIITNYAIKDGTKFQFSKKIEVMLFSFSFKSSILLIFFLHGIVFSTLLLIKGLQNENKSSLWLSLFTILCSLYIAPFMFGYAGWQDNSYSLEIRNGALFLNGERIKQVKYNRK
jgi:nitrate reductase gamma subunit